MTTIPGLIVLAFMAAIWGTLGLLLIGAPAITMAAPVMISVLLYALARQPAFRMAARSPEEDARIGRLVGVWSAAEGIAIPIAALVLANTGRGTAIPSAIAVIVGLHFLPLARWTPRPLNYATGLAMVALGSAGFWRLAQGEMAVGCGVVLWGTCLAMLWQARVGTARTTLQNG